MTLWLAALLGIVQGLTEFIPVSSTAHLLIVPALLGKPDAGSGYTAVIQLGSLVAVIAYFARDLYEVAVQMIRAPWKSEARLLVVATLPIVVAGLFLKKHIEGDLRSLYVISITFVTIGIAMWIIDRHASNRDKFRAIGSMTVVEALMIGLAQTLAVVPGVSRSGSTICMILLLGFSRTDAARFSFLMSIPAIAGAGIFEAKKALVDLGDDAVPALVVGTGVALVVSYVSIAWFMRWLGSRKLVGFAVYRIVCGVALAAAVAAGYLRGVQLNPH